MLSPPEDFCVLSRSAQPLTCTAARGDPGEGGGPEPQAQMSCSSLCPQVRSAIRKRWHRWQDKHSIRARVARAMSIPTSPTRVSFHSIKQSTAV